ncbi:MAG: DUF5050 domain-containing protein [Lachnospiraceae bacterium]|nr:DUF5050 domain-containing protein [Lachnospiraceae bacterium]
MDNKLKNLIIICSVIVFLGIIAVMLFFSHRTYKNPVDYVGNTASNLYNGGYYCEHDGKVYFAYAGDNDSLYVMNPDESGIKKLINTAVLSINVDDHRIYYCQSGKSAGSGLGFVRKVAGLYGSNHKGTNTICYTQNPVARAVLYGNTLFYQNYIKSSGTSLYSIDIARENDHQVSPDMIDPSCIRNGTIYFSGVSGNHYLNALDPLTEAVGSYWEHDVYMPVYHDDGMIYFIDPFDDYTLHRYDPFSDTDTKLSEERIDFYNIYGDIIYYQVSVGPNPSLHRISSDGSGDTVLSEGVFKDIQTTSQYVYYRSFDDETVVFHAPHNGTSPAGPFYVK